MTYREEMSTLIEANHRAPAGCPSAFPILRILDQIRCLVKASAFRPVNVLYLVFLSLGARRVSITLIKEIINSDRVLTPAQKLVLIVISSHAKDGSVKAFPSFPTIASEAGIAVSYAKRIVKQLGDLGCLEINSGRGRGSNHYTVVVHNSRLVHNSRPQEYPIVDHSGTLSDTFVVHNSRPEQVINKNITSTLTNKRARKLIEFYQEHGNLLAQPKMENGEIKNIDMIIDSINKLLKKKWWEEAFKDAVVKANKSKFAQGKLTNFKMNLIWLLTSDEKVKRVLGWKEDNPETTYKPKPKERNKQDIDCDRFKIAWGEMGDRNKEYLRDLAIRRFAIKKEGNLVYESHIWAGQREIWLEKNH